MGWSLGGGGVRSGVGFGRLGGVPAPYGLGYHPVLGYPPPINGCRVGFAPGGGWVKGWCGFSHGAWGHAWSGWGRIFLWRTAVDAWIRKLLSYGVYG